MRADTLLTVFNEMLRVDKDVVVETLFDRITFVFSEDIDICPGTLKIYKDRYGLVVDSKDYDTDYTQSMSLDLSIDI